MNCNVGYMNIKMNLLMALQKISRLQIGIIMQFGEIY